ncbi:BON domain-containing protein [Paraburkholderia sp.]|uniref:BON domain-containing protein n=1 Tax=Paraburkholderia sp. TaxID=1926495 RepID=UPI0039E28B25
MRMHIGRKGLFVFSAMICWATLAQGSASMAHANEAEHVSGPPPMRRMSDRQLAKTVQRAIQQSGGIYMADMAVRAKNGIVTLVGAVPTTTEVSQAAEVAQRVQGVVGVTNNLRTQTQEN